MTTKHFIHLGYNRVPNNALQKEVLELINPFGSKISQNRKYFFKYLKSKLEELNKKHKRCSPVIASLDKYDIMISSTIQDSWYVMIHTYEIKGDVEDEILKSV